MTSPQLFTRAFLAGADDHFLAKQLSNDTVCVETDPTLIERLLTWADLNHILATRPLQPPRLRLHRRGEAVPIDTYTEQVDEAGEQRRVVRPPALYAALRDGASLVLDALDRLHPPVRDAADDLMSMVHERVQTNLYLLWGSTFGFDTHWDDHDTFIVQVAGTKHWTVHGPGRPHPMKVDADQTHACPDHVAWEGVLRPGHILHVPRGWWHTVKGTGDVSAHLTFGFTRTTGIDWAKSLLEHLYSREIFRQDLPRFDSDTARTAHQQALTGDLLELIREQTFEAYLADRDARFPRRQQFSLPWVIDDSDLDDTTLIEFAPLIPPHVENHADRVIVTAAGKRYTFTPAVASILDHLTQHHTATVADLANTSGLSTDHVATIARRLAREHVVFIREAAAD